MVLIQCEDDYIGWIDDDGVSLMDKQKFDEWNKAKKIIVISPFIFAYSEENIIRLLFQMLFWEIY